jgi:hypothetical protein
MQVGLPLLSYREAEEMKSKDGRRTYRSLADGDGTTAASVQRRIRSPSNVTKRRGGGGIVNEDVGRRRASAQAGRWRRRISIPRSGGEAQEAEGQRKKMMAWGKKDKFTPAVLFIYHRVRVVGVAVLHYPDRFCGKSPCGGTEWGGSYCNRATRQ